MAKCYRTILPVELHEQLHSKNATVVLPPKHAHHLSRVVRLTSGDEIIAIDGNGGYCLCQIIANKKQVAITAKEPRTVVSIRKSTVSVALALGAMDKFQLAIAKLCEMGLQSIIPFISEHSVSARGAEGLVSEHKLNHWNSIIESATLQSEQLFIPLIAKTISYQELVTQKELYNLLILDIRGSVTLTTTLNTKPDLKHTVLCIGPEGGFSPQEIDFALSHAIPIVSLGASVLRFETAAIVALGLFHAIKDS
ncbi:MAG: 16S rRNA (uracil(1498)-N(3))-methyltransferase [Methylacidiphilales bacterium]|nr:16S rRNA (uracil(1498)-N(3))-methyltransferase [Candidatus Methylacidiphilales bacterium]